MPGLGEVTQTGEVCGVGLGAGDTNWFCCLYAAVRSLAVTKRCGYICIAFVTVPLTIRVGLCMPMRSDSVLYY